MAEAAEADTAVAGPSSETEEYGDMHRIILQGIMSAGFLDVHGVKNLFTAACKYLDCSREEQKERTAMVYVEKVVRLINEKIQSFRMSIRSASCELTGTKFFIFLITTEHSLVRLQQVFSKSEVDLFTKCLDRMMRKYSNFSVPKAECINMFREIDPRASLSQSEKFIDSMLKMQYFAKYKREDDDYDVTVGIRCLREFELVLTECYPKIVTKCSLCKNILLHGLICPGRPGVPCNMVIHKACFNRFVKTSKDCGTCRRSWARISEMTVRTRQDCPGQEGEPSTSTALDEPSPSTSKAWKNRIDEVLPPSAKSPKPRGKKQNARSTFQPSESDEEEEEAEAEEGEKEEEEMAQLVQSIQVSKAKASSSTKSKKKGGKKAGK